MVDFAKLREDNKKRLDEQVKALKERPVPPSERQRISHVISHHLGEISEWESNFLYSVKLFLSGRPDGYLSDKQAKVLKELEDKYCGSICHALNKAGIAHS